MLLTKSRLRRSMLSFKRNTGDSMNRLCWRRKAGARTSVAVEPLESRMLLTTAPIGDQFLVADATEFESTPAALAVDSGGAFTAAWESFEGDGSGFGVFTQRFAADGSPLSAMPLQVNTTTDREQSAPSIAADSDGNVLIVWQSKGQDGDGFGIYGQWFDNAGTPVNGEFRINSTITGDQKAPAVAINGNGDAVVAWQSFGQDGDDWGGCTTRGWTASAIRRPAVRSE